MRNKSMNKLLAGCRVRGPASRKPAGKVPDLKISDYLQDLTFYPTMKYQEVMMLAMKNEEKSMKFYRAWAEKAYRGGPQKTVCPSGRRGGQA